MQRQWRLVVLLLWSGWGLCGCLPGPTEPDTGQPYARLLFPEEVRLVTVDTQSIDPRLRLRELRLPPGLHRLRFSYAGPSPQHAGQGGALLCLEMQAGHQYNFEAKTLGIMWRPVIATDALIPDYCKNHACTEVDRRLPPQPPILALCPDTLKEARWAFTA